MADRVQHIRHPTATADTFQGLEGELTVDTTRKALRVHDGTTPGGLESARSDLNNVAEATSSVAGKMSAGDKAKLDGISSGAEVNLVDSVFGRTGDVVQVSGDYTASEITNVPAGGIVAVTVQAALDELDGDLTTLETTVNGKLDTNGSGADLTGVEKPGAQTISIPALGLTPRNTNGASNGTVELGTNDIMLATKNFDAATEEAVQIMISMPKSWDEGTVTAQFFWTAASGSGNVVWSARAVAISNDGALDAAWGTEQTITDTLTATDDLCVSATTSPITIGGTPSENDLVVFEFARNAADASDTLAEDAKLINIKLVYTTDAANDA